MIVALDHIAIAVPDLERAIRRFAEDLGLTFDGAEDVPTARTRTAFFPIPGARIELVHPLDGGGPIRKFLDTRGGGLHHVCFRTDDIEADMERLRGLGYRLLSEAPQPGAHGSRTVFIHPASCDGVLIELAEHADHG
ncbi:MAG TPA: methylmalonyl-CoA epimerase [Myxococcota bacterium]|nr:methylmalonyl-CoA epimerase [Myxococcota bacterium]